MPVIDLFGNGKGGLFGGGGGLSGSTFSDVAGGIGDIFAASGDQTKAQALELKAQGDLLEGQNYQLAAQYAGQNAQFTAESTAIKLAQIERQTTMSLGETTADIAGAGFATSGTALDLLRDSASQGAITKAVANQQGLITQAGYQEQAASYLNMEQAAGLAAQEDRLAASAANQAATGDMITGALKGVAALATLV